MPRLSALFITIIIFVLSASFAVAASAKNTASISGDIHHPARRIPAMMICVVNMQTQKKTCIKTKADWQRYHIKKLPEGEYQVIAFAGAHVNSGGYMQQVQCIQAPCEPVKGNIMLAQNQHFDKADLSFPMPAAPTEQAKNKE